MTQHPFELVNQGQTIRGTIYRPQRSGRVPTVLFLHGFRGHRIELGFMFVRLARQMTERGLAAVTFDFRNSGESDGSFDRMLVSGELSDAFAVTQWLTAQPFADRTRLGLLGYSLGGLLAACVVGRSDVFRALVLTSPTTPQNLARYAQSTKFDSDDLVVGPYVLHKDFITDLLAHDPLANVAKHPRPTLLVQGAADTTVTPAVSDQFTQALRRAHVPVTTHLIEGADHLFNAPAAADEMTRTVVSWLIEQLGT